MLQFYKPLLSPPLTQISSLFTPITLDNIKSDRMNTKLKPVIQPSMLSCDFAAFGKECQRMLADGADELHIDIMDGHFVPNLTLGVPVLKSLPKHLPADRPTLDCHLMVTNPANYVESLAALKVVAGITFHYECELQSIEELCKQIQAKGIRAGVSIKPQTPVDDRLKELIEAGLVDMVLVMTVEPGFGGQPFMPETMDKVRLLRGLYPDLNIQVDGGITTDTIATAAEAGANFAVSGSGVFGSKDPKAAMDEMRQQIQKQLGK